MSTPLLASWIRESDQTHFAEWFGSHRGVAVWNARENPGPAELPDGLLLTGGPDLSGEFHAVPPSDLTLIRDAEPARDAWEMTAVRAALERGIPILAICKGMQVLNVALGGTLHFDIPGHDHPEQKTANVQRLRYAAGARHRFELVNSSHHQALDRVADQLEVEAWSASDGVVEQVRIRNYPWGAGVQYHPERDAAYYAALFEDFLDNVKRFSHGPVRSS